MPSVDLNSASAFAATLADDGLNLAAANAALKVNYQPDIRDQLMNVNVVWAQMQRRTVQMQGKKFYVSLRIGRNEGTGFVDEDNDLPEHGRQKYDFAVYDQMYQYTRIRLTGPVMEQTRGDEGAFMRALDSEVNGAIEDTARDSNRIIWNDGTGRLATLPAAGAGAGATIDVTSLKFLQIDQKVSIKQSDGTVLTDTSAAGDYIIAKTTAKATPNIEGNIELSASRGGPTLTPNVTGGDATYGIYRAAVQPAPGKPQNEANGLASVVSATGQLGALDPATSGEEFWASTVTDQSTYAADWETDFEDYMQEALDDVEENDGGNINFVVMSLQYRRAFATQLTTFRTFDTMDTVTLNGGFKALNYNDIAIATDRDATGAAAVPFTGERAAGAGTNDRPGSVYLIDLNHLFVMETGPAQFWDHGAGILHRVTNRDAVEALFRHYYNVGTDRRRAHGILQLPPRTNG